MIKSLNATVDDDRMDLFVQELEERDEMICLGKACAANAELCVGQACGAACIGISVCAAGVHVGF